MSRTTPAIALVGELAAALVVAATPAALAIGACAKSEPADLSRVPPDAGPPVGFAECRDEYFGSYLNPCSSAGGCAGVLQCDLTRAFAQTARCHSRLCDIDSECVDAFKTLCVGDDFHYECVRANDLDPTECRLVEGATK